MTVMTDVVRLNFACGPTQWPGFDNSDIDPAYGASVIDLEQRPYPYPDETAELILISHGLHLTYDGYNPIHPNFQAIMREFHRILRPAGWLRIDDNPWRTYDTLHAADNEGLGYPRWLRISRVDFCEMLRHVGFGVVAECDPDTTQIPADDDTRQAIIGNHAGHDSFAVEACKC